MAQLDVAEPEEIDADAMQRPDLASKITTKPIIIPLDDGNSKVFVHDDRGASPIRNKRGHGFDELSNPQCKFIEFEYDFRIHKDSIEATTENGCTLQSGIPMVVYHNYVWWNYAYKLILHGDESELQFTFYLLNIGPETSAFGNEPLPKGALRNDALSKQKAPKARNVKLRIGYRNGSELICVTEANLKANPRNDNYFVKNVITERNLKDLIKQNDILIFRITLQIERDYFNFEPLPDDTNSATIDPDEGRNRKTLEAVLSGKKTANSDFVFTRGDSSTNDSTEYFVHKSPLAYTSISLQSIFRQKVSLPTDQILVESSQDRIIFPHLSESDMKVLLTYLYTEKVILPDFNRFARVGRVISFLFDRFRLLKIFDKWQQLIINDLVQMANENKKKAEQAMRSLIAIYSAPYGALPIAKRVALSTLADQILRQGDELVDEIKNDEQFKKYSIEHILESALKLKTLVADVKKTSAD